MDTTQPIQLNDFLINFTALKLHQLKTKISILRFRGGNPTDDVTAYYLLLNLSNEIANSNFANATNLLRDAHNSITRDIEILESNYQMEQDFGHTLTNDKIMRLENKRQIRNALENYLQL